MPLSNYQMLSILPFFAFVAFWIFLANSDYDCSWRKSALRGAILCSIFGILSTELLSLIHGVKPLGLSLSWGFFILVAVYILRKKHIQNGFIRFPAIRVPQSWMDRVLITSILAIIIITAALGLLTPPQSVDSLHYHMSRIAHWDQEGSLNHFATGISVLNSMTPGAEILILHTYVLSQGDHFVNSLQWMAMVLSILGASYIAKQLGGNKASEIFSAVFVASLPMGITQASNTLNDYLATLWVICVISEGLNLNNTLSEPGWKSTLVFLSLASSLVILTKATAIPFLIFPSISVILFIYKKRAKQGSIRWAIFGFLLIFLVLSGFLIRNLITYSYPIDRELINLHRNELITLRGVLSNVLKNAGLHAGTPWENVNSQIYRIISAIHYKIGVDLNDPKTSLIGYFSVSPPTTHEAYTGNSAHAYLILVSLFLVIFRRKSIGLLAFLYGAAIISGFFLFSALYKWQISGSRYHLPFFATISPFVACVICSFKIQYLNNLISLALLIASWPWLFGIQSRPFIPAASNTPIKSVFTETRDYFYDVNVPWVKDKYQKITDEINRIQCSKVGLMMGGSTMEYLIWVQLGAPKDDLEIEWIISGTPSERYVDKDFSPCAIICEKCPKDMLMIRGLPISIEEDDFRLYSSYMLR